MDELVEEYKRLYGRMIDLIQARCFCKQSGLEHVQEKEVVQKYKSLGVYNPDKNCPDFALANMSELELQMVETTSQLRLLYNIIEKEDTDIAHKLEDHNRAIDAMHQQLEASLTFTLRQSIGYDDEQANR